MCFINSPEYTYLEQREPDSTFKNKSCRKYSFQKQSLFSQGNNVLHTAGTNLDGFVRRDTCATSTSLNRPTWNKMSLS
jgi:hypothetical protein